MARRHWNTSGSVAPISTVGTPRTTAPSPMRKAVSQPASGGLSVASMTYSAWIPENSRGVTAAYRPIAASNHAYSTSGRRLRSASMPPHQAPSAMPPM